MPGGLSVTHLLVTNDFPPKTGGIQSYLWELWSRIEPDRFAVLTIDHPAAGAFDDGEGAGRRIERLPMPMLLPTPALERTARRLADEVGAGLVVLDPTLPVGLAGRRLGRPYAVVLHGAELTVPARLPATAALARGVLERATLLVAAGGYPLAEARRLLGGAGPEAVVIPPGVDAGRFRPLAPAERLAARHRLGVPPDALLVASVSRLVPRKGMDVLIEAVAALVAEHPRLLLLIGGTGRDAPRLASVSRRERAPVRFLGRVDDADLPSLYGCCDVFAMLCRTRWLGLEQEGYGVVFNEAAACGVAAVAGRSGGADEAVLDGRTGLVVERPGDVRLVVAALGRLLGDPALRRDLATAARRRAETELSADVLAAQLAEVLAQAELVAASR